MRRFPLILAVSLLSVAVLSAPARAASTPSPSPSETSDSASTPSASPSAEAGKPETPSPVPSNASPTPSAPAGSLPATPKPKATPAASVAPSPAPSAPAAPSADDLAALALIDELTAFAPDVVGYGETPMERLQQAAAAIRTRLVAVEARLSSWLAEQSIASQRLAAAQQRLDEASEAVARAETAIRDHAGDLYMGPVWSDMAVYAAGTFEDIGRAKAYMTAVLGEDVGVIAGLRAAMTGLERDRDAAVDAAARVSAAGAAIKRERALLDLLSRKMRAVLDQVVRSFGAGSADFARTILAAQRDQAPASVLERFVFAPVAGSVSSPFGPRVHPIYRYRSMHTGIDLAAPAGTPVRAARDGVVLSASFAGPFGLAVVIDHGSSIATVSAHLAGALVEPGDRVTAGQEIGLTGCTGWCTGPHVHFEVWFGGVPQDPAPWMIAAPSPGPKAPLARPVSKPATEPAPNPPGAETLAGLRNPFEDLSARP